MGRHSETIGIADEGPTQTIPPAKRWSEIVGTWRCATEELDVPEFERFEFTDVPTRLVNEIGEIPRLDWWNFPPWPTPTELAEKHGLGPHGRVGPNDTLQMLWEVREDADAVIAVLLRASLRQLFAYPPSGWAIPGHHLVMELATITHDAPVRQPTYRWHSAVKTTLPVSLFADSRRWHCPTGVHGLVHLIALEHAYLLSRHHAVRAVPLSSSAPRLLR